MKLIRPRYVICEHCHVPFMTTSNQTVRYCSPNHQRAAHKNTNRSRIRKHHELEFVGVDGEGVGRGNNHRYVLLGCGEKQHENPSGIRWDEALQFLWGCFL